MIKILISTLIFILAAFLFFKINKVKNLEALVIDYYGCLHCNINDSTFIRLNNPNVYYYYYNKKLSFVEYAGVVKYANSIYENKLNPEFKSDSLNKDYKLPLKSQFVEKQLNIFNELKVQKLKKWKKLVDPDSQNKPNLIDRLAIIIFQKWFL